jgi:hypothetical protein
VKFDVEITHVPSTEPGYEGKFIRYKDKNGNFEATVKPWTVRWQIDCEIALAEAKDEFAKVWGEVYKSQVMLEARWKAGLKKNERGH